MSQGESRSRVQAHGLGVKKAAGFSLPFSPTHLNTPSGELQSPQG